MSLRAPTLADLPAALAVVAAREIVDLGVVDTTIEDLRWEWRLSTVDLAADARLVEDGSGSVIGYGMLRDHGASAVVDRDAEGQGAGSLLLDWLEQRARQLGRASHRQLVAAPNQSAAALLTARGYRVASSNYRMATSLAGLGTRSDSPPGLILHRLAAEQTEVIHALDERAFQGDPSYEPEPLSEFREEHLQAHDAAPELSLVAVDRGRVIGFLLARRRAGDGVGYVDLLAVDPGHHGRGVGRALLAGAFAGFAAAGLRRAELTVSSSNPGAVRLYERARMHVCFRHDVYERPL